MIKKFTRIVLLIGLAFASVALPARQAFAAPTAIIFDVNSFLDQPDDLTMIGTCHTAVGTCTLRAAVMQANRTSGAGATIRLPAGLYGLTIPASGADGEENGDLNLTAPPALTNPVINILGAGASTTIIDANQIDRVFKIAAGRTVTISGVTISGGYSSLETGGGIDNLGSLTLNDSTITGNTTVLYGGGIENDGLLTINNSTITLNNAIDGAGIYSLAGISVAGSTISRNTATRYGGGIYDFKSVDMGGSTLYGNSATLGGGIYVTNAASLTAWNSTLSQNTASQSGGGIYNDTGATNLYNVSIVSNSSNTAVVGGSAGGIYNNDKSGATTNIRNTLLAGNTMTDVSTYSDCAGTLSLYGNNDFWFTNDCIFNIPFGGNVSYLTALNTLGPLKNNGGPTWTVALLPGNIAINGGDAVYGCVDYASIPLATDQRGYARVVGPVCDIGAFEYSPLNYVYLPVLFR